MPLHKIRKVSLRSRKGQGKVGKGQRKVGEGPGMSEIVRDGQGWSGNVMEDHRRASKVRKGHGR